MGKLLDALSESPTEEKSKKSQPLENCAVVYQRQCCRGTGVHVFQKGAFSRAELCECVKNCTACFGTAQKIEDGFARACAKPSPVHIVNMINDAAIPARYAGASLDHFANQSGNCNEIIGKLKEWLFHFRLDASKGIILSGQVGVGKTYIMAALAKYLAFKGMSVKFIDFFQLISKIKAVLFDKESNMDFLPPLIDVDVLVIDELGKGRSTDFEATILDQLVMGRYNQNKIILATTNCTFQQKIQNTQAELDSRKNPYANAFNSEYDDYLENRVGSRIYSRLIETTLPLEIWGEDYRKTRGQPWNAYSKKTNL